MMTGEVDITGLDKAEVLAALYNASKVQGMGVMQAVLGDMTAEKAREVIASRGDDHGNKGYFDYLFGRVLKVNISGDSFDPRGYDRDVGQGAASRAISKLRAESEPMTETPENKPPTGNLVDVIGPSWHHVAALIYDCGTVVLVQPRKGIAMNAANIEEHREDLGDLMIRAIKKATARFRNKTQPHEEQEPR
jgi:hypothetical protein